MEPTMNNNIRIFEHKDFGSVRTATQNGEPWFCLADVCRVLEIENPRDIKKRLSTPCVDTIYVGVQTGAKADGTPAMQNVKMTFVNEQGLYKVIFQSRKPEAEKFTDWVTGEVLPSIRRNGGYIAGQEDLTEKELLAKAVLVCNRIIQEREKRIADLEQEALANEPKVQFADAVSVSNDCISIGELAKVLKGNGIDIGQNRLFDWLRNNGYLIRRNGIDYNVPTQKAMKLGLFKIKESTITTKNGNTLLTTCARVTGKGQQYFIRKFLEDDVHSVDVIDTKGKPEQRY